MARSDLERLIQWECTAVRRVRRSARMLRPLVSRDPRADICTIVYLFAAIACFEIGVLGKGARLCCFIIIVVVRACVY